MATIRMPSVVFGASSRPRQAQAQTLVVQDVQPDLTRARPQTHIDEDMRVGTALFRFPQRKGVMPEQARAFSDTNEWLRAAINRMKDRVSRAERAIIPVDPNKPFSAEIQGRIAYLMENPNPRGDSWRSFIEPVIEDVLVLGRGGWEYVPNWRGWPVALYPYNAQFMSINPFWDGSNPRQDRYYWAPLPRAVYGLRNDECTMIILNPRSDRQDGLGWVDSLRDSIEADAAGNMFVQSLLKRYPPPGWLHLGATAGKKAVEAVSERLNTDVLGQGGMLVTGGLDAPTFQSLWVGNSKDNQLMEWSQYFGMKICAVAGISPQDIGLTMDINLANGQVQQQVGSESGYKSLLSLVQEYFNREVIGKFGTPETLNLHMVFKELTAKDRGIQVDIATKMTGGIPIALYNEARAEADLPPLELGNVVFVKTMEGAMPLIGDDVDAYHRQRLGQQADLIDLEAKEKDTAPDGGRPTRNKKAPAATGTQGGASNTEQDKAAANSKPAGAA